MYQFSQYYVNDLNRTLEVIKNDADDWLTYDLRIETARGSVIEYLDYEPAELARFLKAERYEALPEPSPAFDDIMGNCMSMLDDIITGVKGIQKEIGKITEESK